MLQWGRLTMEAERQGGSGVCCCGHTASMGPPHDGGGEAICRPRTILTKSRLQWGRLTMEAERGDPCRRIIVASVLQWGRLTMEAERRLRPRDRSRAGASMGPPHDGGGEAMNGGWEIERWALQWGRLTMEAESPERRTERGVGRLLQWGRLTMEAERHQAEMRSDG